MIKQPMMGFEDGMGLLIQVGEIVNPDFTIAYGSKGKEGHKR
jgi:hypothetical protein